MITSLVEIFRLDEVRGRIPELDNILDTFKTKLEKNIQGKTLPAKIVLTNRELWTKESFFNNIQVRVFVQKGLMTKATGELFTTNLRLVNEKLNWVSMTLNVVWDPKDSLEEMVDKAGSDFSHEITHAYEEYERLKKGAPSLDAKDYQTRYAKIRQDAESVPEHIVKSILYFTDKVEQKAFLGEMYSEAKRLAKQGYSGNDLYKAVLKNSQAGRSYLACKQLMNLWNGKEKYHGETIKELADRETPNWKEKLVQTWNDIYGTHVESVGDIQIKLNRIWDKFESVFKTKLGKIVHDASNQ